MNRKKFIQTSLPLAAIPALNGLPKIAPHPVRQLIPPYLKEGSVIGITCPSGHISHEEIQPAVCRMRDWGFHIRVGSTVGLQEFTRAGSDAQRATDMQAMLDDPEIEAIMLGRGGYGAIRIIDRLNFENFRKRPKWIIGFSDATVFHMHINSRLGLPTIHSKMCNSFPENPFDAFPEQADSIDAIRRCLLGEPMTYAAPTLQQNRPGAAEALLTGGNLSVIQIVSDSISDLDGDGKILFLEDVGEYLYRLDGMLWNLKRSGKLDRLKGLIIGAFRIKPDDPGDEFGKSLHEIVMEKVAAYNYPVCFDFPVGHVYVNYALKCGIPHRLEVQEHSAALRSLG